MADDETTVETDDETAEDTSEKKDVTEEEGESKSSTKTEERDYAKEIAEEEAKGKPDPKKAREAFKERDEKREEGSDDKPLTRKDIEEIEARAPTRATKIVLESQALSIAKTLATSEPEANLILAKWRNRVFPENMPLHEQIEEMYAITHRKRLIGTANEAMRALKNKSGIKTDPSGTQREPAATTEPKLSAQDATAYKSAGFVWDGTKNLYNKPLMGVKQHLYKDQKTKRQWIAV